MKNYALVSIVAGISLFAASAYAANPGRNFESDSSEISKNAKCYTYNFKDDDIIRIDAGLYKHTFIRLPEDALDTIFGDAQGAKNSMWENRWIKSNLVVKPLSSNPLGAETTITVIGYSGRTYNFLVTRKKNPDTFCYRIVTDGEMLHPEIWKKYDAQVAGNQSAQLAQLAALNESKNRAVESDEVQAREGLKKYRKSINTNYKVTSSSGYFAPKGIISSVYDDGRFTYVRLNSDKNGLLSIFGEIDSKKEVLEFDYDSPSKTYTVSGVFPKFVLKAADSEAVIESTEQP